jgi:HptB-dependent secretion and biofilm anti anti-sigma factor
MSSRLNKFTVSEDSHSINIKINIERFDFNAHSSFHATYIERSLGAKYKIDFAKVKFVDSSALGILLMFRQHNGLNNKLIELVNCSKEVESILITANLDQLFEIKSLN